MKAIYEPKGKAKEYSDLAINIYKGCNHGCSYCYAPDIWRKMGLSREDFYNHPTVRFGIVEAVEKEAPKYKGREVHLCFSCDPYQLIDEKLQVTRRVIKILKDNDITVRILTKGGFRSMRDFDLLESNKDWFGVTMTFIDPKKSSIWEPDASSPAERYASLVGAKLKGLQTWMSLEPVIDPAETLKIIEMTHIAVDVFKIGKWNHDARAKEIDWPRFVTQAVTLLDKLGKKYYIKEDLRKYLI